MTISPKTHAMLMGSPTLLSALGAAGDTTHPVTGEPVRLTAGEKAKLSALVQAPTLTVPFLRDRVIAKMVRRGEMPAEAIQLAKNGATPEELGLLALKHNLPRILDRRDPSAVAAGGGTGAVADAAEATTETLGMSAHRLPVYARDDTPASRFVAMRLAEREGVPYGGVRGIDDVASTAATMGLHAPAAADAAAEVLDPATLAEIEDARVALREGIEMIAAADAGGLTPEARLSVLQRTVKRLSDVGPTPTLEATMIQQILDHPDPRIASDAFIEEMIAVNSEPAKVAEAAHEVRTLSATKVAAPAAVSHADDAAHAASQAIEAASVAVKAATAAKSAAADAHVISEAARLIPSELHTSAPALVKLASRGSLATATEMERTLAELVRVVQHL